MLVDVEYSSAMCDGFGIVRTSAIESLVKHSRRPHFLQTKVVLGESLAFDAAVSAALFDLNVHK